MWRHSQCHGRYLSRIGTLCLSLEETAKATTFVGKAFPVKVNGVCDAIGGWVTFGAVEVAAVVEAVFEVLVAVLARREL